MHPTPTASNTSNDFNYDIYALTYNMRDNLAKRSFACWFASMADSRRFGKHSAEAIRAGNRYREELYIYNSFVTLFISYLKEEK